MANHREIAQKIKPITCDERDHDFVRLCTMGREMRAGKENAVSDRCRIGNNVVDFFTFEERLRTRSKYNIHFFDFVERIEEFKEKKFIRNMLSYYENIKNKNKTKNEFVVLKEVFNICIGAINIFRPLMAMDVYAKYNPCSVLDICAGWGGRCVGAAAIGVPRYTGIELNHALEHPYQQLTGFLETRSPIDVHMRFEDAVNTDYASLYPYDMVFTSPPYYFLEKYSNNAGYKNKRHMDAEFYTPLFQRSYAHLVSGGHFILNVNKEIYDEVCIPLLGEAHETLPFKKSKRQNEYTESIYVWKKE